MNHARIAFALGSFLAAGLVPASAQAGEWGVALDAGMRTMSNSADTQKAIFDSSYGVGLGLGVSYDLGAHWRFGVEGRRVSRDGERAFALDRTAPAFRLGHPLKFTMDQGLVTAAYRFGRIGPVSPYFAVGGGFVSWKERSDIAGLIESASGTSALFEGRLGIERQQGPVRIGIEGGLTFMPSAIGVGGISAVYEEKDLGGLFVVFKLGFSQR